MSAVKKEIVKSFEFQDVTQGQALVVDGLTLDIVCNMVIMNRNGTMEVDSSEIIFPVYAVTDTGMTLEIVTTAEFRVKIHAELDKLALSLAAVLPDHRWDEVGYC